MYILPNANAFNSACEASSRTVSAKCEIVVGGITTTMTGDGINGEIISMEWDNLVCSNDGLQIGTTCMDSFKMECRPVTTTIDLMGKELHPYIGIDVNGTPTYVPIGVFYVTNTESNDDGKTYTVTAYDGMQNFLDPIDFTALGVTLPVNAWTLLEAIANKFGVTLTYTETVYNLLSSDNYNLVSADNYNLVVDSDVDSNRNASLENMYEGSYRDYIGWIAGLVGAYAHFGRSGDLVIKRYEDTGFTISRNVQHLGGAKINYGGSVTYTNIVSGTDGEPVYSASYTGNAITYSNPFINTQELEYICDDLIGEDGITVTPCNVAWRSNPCVDAGDIISVEDKDGNPLTVYVMDRTVKVTGGLSETLNCYGETEVAKSLNTSPLVTKMANISKTAQTTADMINATSGTMQMLLNPDGSNYGYRIVEDDGTSWLQCTAGGIGLSSDGGLTYNNAITKNGVTASELHVIRNGVEVMSADEGTNGYPELVMRDNDGDQILKITPYAISTTVENSDTGVYLRLYDASGNALAYLGTRGNSSTGEILGASLSLYNPTANVQAFRAYYDIPASTAYLQLNNTSTGGNAFVASSTSVGSGLHLYKSDGATEVVGLSNYTSSDGTSSNTQLHVDDPSNGATQIHLISSRYNNTVGNTLAIYGVYADPSDTSTTLLGIEAHCRYDGSAYSNGISMCYAGTSNKALDISSSGSSNLTVYVDGHTLTWKTVTINGTTYHFLGY